MVKYLDPLHTVNKPYHTKNTLLQVKIMQFSPVVFTEKCTRSNRIKSSYLLCEKMPHEYYITLHFTLLYYYY